MEQSIRVHLCDTDSDHHDSEQVSDLLCGEVSGPVDSGQPIVDSDDITVDSDPKHLKYEAFRSLFDELVKSVTPALDEVARKVFAKRLLTQDSLIDAQNLLYPATHRTSKLLMHISDRIRDEEGCFDKFVEILEEIPSLECMYKKLRNTAPSDSASDKKAGDPAILSEDSKILSSRDSEVSPVDSRPSVDVPTNHDYEVFRDLFDDLVKAVMPAVEEVARKAFSKRLMTRDNLISIQNPMYPNSYKASTLLIHILGRIEQREEGCFNTFVKILEELPSLEYITKKLRKKALQVSDEFRSTPALSEEVLSYRDSKERPFDLSDEEVPIEHHDASNQTVCDQDFTVALSEVTKAFPYLDIKKLSELELRRLSHKLFSETKNIISAFGRLVATVFNSFEHGAVSAKKLGADIITLWSHPMQLPEKQRKTLQHANSLSDIQVFLVTNKYISFLNFKLMEDIVDIHGKQEDQANMNEYLNLFSKFCERSVFEVPSHIIKEHSPKGEEKLVVKVSKEFFGGVDKRFTMQHLKDVQGDLERIIGCPFLFIHDIKKGCVEITFAIVTCSPIIPLSNSVLKLISEAGIKVITQHSEFAQQQQKVPVADPPLKIYEDPDTPPIPFDLHSACLIGDYDCVQDAINSDKDINIFNKAGWTPLIYASFVGHDVIVNLLLDSGAEHSLGTPSKLSPLMVAARCNNESVCYFLIQAGAEIDAQDSNGLTALMYATRQGHQTVVQLLLESGCDLEAQDENGYTALMLAAQEGDEIIVDVLVACGANMAATDKWGNTARSIANERHHIRTVTLLDNAVHILESMPFTVPLHSISDIEQDDDNCEDSTEDLFSSKYKAYQKHRAVQKSKSLPDVYIDLHQSAIWALKLKSAVSMPEREFLHDKSGDSDRLANFLSQLGLEKYLKVFQEQEIDFNVLHTLTDEDLRIIGIKLMGPRRKLSQAISELNKKRAQGTEEGMEGVATSQEHTELMGGANNSMEEGLISNLTMNTNTTSNTSQLLTLYPAQPLPNSLASTINLPQITNHPCDQNKIYGDSVVFKVCVSGRGLFTYQWYRDDEEITHDTHPYCTGQLTDTLSIKVILTEYEGSYKCVVNNQSGSAESHSAQLSVVSPVTSLFSEPSVQQGTLSVDAKPQNLSPLGPPKVEHVGIHGRIIDGIDKGIKLRVPPQASAKENEEINVQIQSFTPSNSLVELPPGIKFVSPVYEVLTSSDLIGAEATIEHYADLESGEDNSDMTLLQSLDEIPPYRFQRVDGGDFSGHSNVSIVPLKTSGRYAIGAGNERPERYTLYFIYPIPKLSEECQYALFSASYRQHAFEQHLLQEMHQRFEHVMFWPVKSNVSLAGNSDGFELNVPLIKEGYSITPLFHQNFKIYVKDLVDYTTVKDTRTCLPPTVLMYVELLSVPPPTQDLECTINVVGIKEDVKFTLKYKAPKAPGNQAHSVQSTEISSTSKHGGHGPNKLTKEDIRHLKTILAPYASKWRDIGSELGFKVHELGSIEANREYWSHGSVGYLAAMIEEWGKWSKDSRRSLATQEALEASLSSASVDLREVAKSLKQDLQNSKENKPILPPIRSQGKRLRAKRDSLFMTSDHFSTQNVYGNIGEYSAKVKWDLHDLHDHGIDGKDIVIAILDTGVKIEHHAFSNEKRIFGMNFVCGDLEHSWKTDPGDHGTMTAFIVGGKSFHDIPSGVAPEATLLICRVGDGKKFRVSAVIKALEKLVDLKYRGEDNLHVVSMSFGMPYNPESEDQRKIQDLILKLKERHVICVAAAGNYGQYNKDIQFPACSEDVICVGALTSRGCVRDSSALGIDVYAPGELVPAPSSSDSNIMTTFAQNGSSCAAPAIAGLIALLLHYSNKCVADDQEKKKFQRLLYLKLEVFGKEMKGRFPYMLEPGRFFKSHLKHYEQIQEIERLKHELVAY